MKEIINLGFKLLLICLIAALSLGYVNDITKDKIAYQNELANKKARTEVMPLATEFNELKIEKNKNILEAYEAFKGEELVGYIFKTSPSGYGGALEMMVGISLDEKITGVRVVKHNETPGLGAKAQSPEFYNQYTDMSSKENIGVSKTSSSEKEVKAISGATITSKAVTKGVNNAIEIFKSIKE